MWGCRIISSILEPRAWFLVIHKIEIRKKTLSKKCSFKKIWILLQNWFHPIAQCVRVCKIPMHQCRQTIRIFLRWGEMQFDLKKCEVILAQSCYFKTDYPDSLHYFKHGWEKLGSMSNSTWESWSFKRAN